MMHAVTGSFYLGTSGFAYDGWKHDVFYPEGLKNREMLSYYSSQLNSVEINYTFRRFPTKNSLITWREQAADGFVFTLKANQRITHSRRLKDADDDVRDFLGLAKVLGDRLGCVLFQCPPPSRSPSRPMRAPTPGSGVACDVAEASTASSSSSARSRAAQTAPSSSGPAAHSGAAMPRR